MSEARRFHATFCDDIRHEINGKVSLIGCYSGMMFVPVFPVTLPRLCVYVYFSIPKNQPLEGIISLSVLKDGDTLTKTEILADHAIQQAEQNPATPNDAQNYLIISGFEFSPLQIENPGVLQVVAELNGEVMIGERLRIGQMPSSDPLQ